MKRIIIMLIAVVAMASCEKEELDQGTQFEYAVFEIDCSWCEITYVNGGVSRTTGGKPVDFHTGSVMIDGVDEFEFKITDGYRFSKKSFDARIKMLIKDKVVYDQTHKIQPLERDKSIIVKFR